MCSRMWAGDCDYYITHWIWYVHFRFSLNNYYNTSWLCQNNEFQCNMNKWGGKRTGVSTDYGQWWEPGLVCETVPNDITRWKLIVCQFAVIYGSTRSTWHFHFCYCSGTLNVLYHRQEIIESIIYGVIWNSLTNEVDCQTSNGMHSLQLQVVNRNSERSKITVVGTKACNHRWHWKVKSLHLMWPACCHVF